MPNNFWKNKKVLITGHTGFKGGWASLFLFYLGAKIYGYSLAPINKFNFYDICSLNKFLVEDKFDDLRNYLSLKKFIEKVEPDIIYHFAAQSLVGNSYSDPLTTYSTNVMGTANLLNIAREVKSIKSIINVTSDKCYLNKEKKNKFTEDDKLGGIDPYSSSKSCSEILTNSFYESFFKDIGTGIASVRAGNVIGGGDWSESRLFPDCIRSIFEKKKLIIRNIKSTRPWQHVLDPLYGYILLGEKLFDDQNRFSGPWNFGPSTFNSKNVNFILKRIKKNYSNFTWDILDNQVFFRESFSLNLDSSKSIKNLQWKPKIDIENSIDITLLWYKYFYNQFNMYEISLGQIDKYLSK